MKNGKVFKIIVPLDTCILDQYDFIFRKKVDTTNWVLYPVGGGGGNVIHDFWFLHTMRKELLTSLKSDLKMAYILL